MLNRLRNRLEHYKSTRIFLLKLVLLGIFLALFLLQISLGITDPTSPPPGPR
ncbi:MAG: hypothetical protein ACFFAE_09685 [Candidatus Hodarchaeota archaeon]